MNRRYSWTVVWLLFESKIRSLSSCNVITGKFKEQIELQIKWFSNRSPFLPLLFSAIVQFCNGFITIFFRSHSFSLFVNSLSIYFRRLFILAIYLPKKRRKMLSLAKKREQSMHYYEWQSKQNAKLIFFLKTTIAITNDNENTHL